MQEVATGKYHGHSSGGLSGVPPVPRTDATITLFCRDALVSNWHISDIRPQCAGVSFWA
jgi:hypothetical protein